MGTYYFQNSEWGGGGGGGGTRGAQSSAGGARAPHSYATGDNCNFMSYMEHELFGPGA